MTAVASRGRRRVAGPRRLTRYVIRGATGQAIATHVRADRPSGKVVWWEAPDGSHGLPPGVGVRDLPLYGSELVAAWPAGAILVTEGEKAADALVAIGALALGTVTGAGAVPTVAAVAPIARGRAFVLWPDADAAGRSHMVRLAGVLRTAGASRVRLIDYRPTVATAIWPSGFDAADLVAGMDPALAWATVAVLIDEWATRAPDPPRLVRPRRRPIDDEGSVSSALVARYGLDRAAPGRNVRCPRHDDRHASLSILRDDRRAICKAPSCPWASPGITAGGIDG